MFCHLKSNSNIVKNIYFYLIYSSDEIILQADQFVFVIPDHQVFYLSVQASSNLTRNLFLYSWKLSLFLFDKIFNSGLPN